jgi:methyltransferase (TIGR00027 family)
MQERVTSGARRAIVARVPDPVLRDVPDTAFLVAAFRARESERPDALFRDPLAARLVGDRVPELVHRMPGSFFGGWSLVIRTVVIDRLIAGALAAGADVVLNLGAGLDTRPYRLDLPASLRWVEVDYPRMLAFKERELADATPRCALERLPADLTVPSERRAAIHGACAGARRVLVLTEGVLPYLENDAVTALAADLAAEPAVQGWITDYFSPQALQVRNRSARHRRILQNAPFRFDPGDWFAFFAERGWAPREMVYLGEEGARLGRPFPMPWWMKLLVGARRLTTPKARRGSFARFVGYALLERRG